MTATSKIACIAAMASSLLTMGSVTARADDDEDDGYGDSERIEIEGKIPPRCDFTNAPSSGNIGVLSPGAVVNIGVFGFTCNLATVNTVKVTITSANGGLKRDGGTETAPYEVSWQVQGTTTWTPAATLIAPKTINLLSGPNGVEQGGGFNVRVNGPLEGLPAGTYRDTLTYTVSP